MPLKPSLRGPGWAGLIQEPSIPLATPRKPPSLTSLPSGPSRMSYCFLYSNTALPGVTSLLPTSHFNQNQLIPKERGLCGEKREQRENGVLTKASQGLSRAPEPSPAPSHQPPHQHHCIHAQLLGFSGKSATKPQCRGPWAPAALEARRSELTLCAEGPGWQGLSLRLPQFPHLQKEDRFSGCPLAESRQAPSGSPSAFWLLYPQGGSEKGEGK